MGAQQFKFLKKKIRDYILEINIVLNKKIRCWSY